MVEPEQELQQIIEQAKERLGQRAVPTEKAVEYAVVMPILQVLGWNPQNIDEMYPEYGVESKRVDWALLKEGKPCVFLEEKAPDQNLSAHEEQLLEYAFKQGVPLAVLTNGGEWWFYLPLEEGPWGERKFLVIDLMNQDVEETSLQLTQFLQEEFVHGGLAYKDAKERYDEARERKRIREKLPEAIREVLSSSSDRVIEFFQNQTQPDIGTLPPPDLVKQALKDITQSLAAEQPKIRTAAAGPKERRHTATLDLPPSHCRPISFTIEGETIAISQWNQLLIETANWLIKHHYELPIGNKPGYRMTFFSKSGRDLNAPKKLNNGLYIETNYSARSCIKNARWLLRQAGLAEDDLQVQWEQRSR